MDTFGRAAEVAIAQFQADTAREIERLAVAASATDQAILRAYAATIGMSYPSSASAISKVTGIRPQRIIVEVLFRYVPIAQSRAKLLNYQRNGLSQYDITTAPDACACCLAAATAGPYLVAEPTAIPGLLGCDHCRCAIAPYIGD